MESAKTKKIVLVRHGQSTQNATQVVINPQMITLTELGIRQARATGKYLADCGIFRFEKIYASDMVRAVETAALIRRAMDFQGPLFQLEGLRERDAPYFDEKTREELKQKFVEKVKADHSGADANDALVQSVVFPKMQDAFEEELGAEPMARVQARALRTLQSIADEANGDVVVVSHYEMIRAIVTGFTGIPSYNPPTSKRGHANCTITVIEVGPQKKMNLVHLPSAWHLDSLEP